MGRPPSPGAPGAAGQRWPWLPFVDLSLAMAVAPGFLLGGLMASVSLLNLPAGAWYAAARQAHGHAQMIGWGGAMILGVGLHFLPRLRGVAAPAAARVRPLFVAFALGLSLRLLGQPAAALVASRGQDGVGAWGFVLRLLFQSGAVLELAAVLGLLLQLVATLRGGPPLGHKRAFAEVVPFMVAAGGGLVVALLAWTLGSVTREAATSALIPGHWDLLATHAAVLGLVPAVSVGMSVRLFPLYLRLAPARPGWTRVAAGLFGFVLLVYGAALFTGPGPLVYGLGAVAGGAALPAGAVAVRVFERRRAFPGDRGRYRVWSEPVAVGVVTAYGWGLLGGVASVIYGLGFLLPGTGLPGVSFDLVVHLLGAGFMTLLILGVGAVLLPGFGGGKPGSRPLLWGAVVTANLAALLRVLPGTSAALGTAAPAWSPAAMGWAGVLGVAAVGLFALYLRSSWPGAAPRPGRRG